MKVKGRGSGEGYAPTTGLLSSVMEFMPQRPLGVLVK